MEEEEKEKNLEIANIRGNNEDPTRMFGPRLREEEAAGIRGTRISSSADYSDGPFF